MLNFKEDKEKVMVYRIKANKPCAKIYKIPYCIITVDQAGITYAELNEINNYIKNDILH